MKIYTSYFGNLRKLKENNISPIGIARWAPRFYTGPSMKDVAPTPFMLSDACSNEQYITLYKQMLQRMNPSELQKRMLEYGHGNDVALLCYEKPGDFCHRHMFAEWFSKATGIEVEEFGIIKEEKSYEEGTLF